ncbi:thiamine pyrophosphate-dependent acetolactate synthase large subunit-like protein [Antricoccus suffuscus]|uniref:Thiamine pyrophosphate-dependent acetolactate synthase large subunit-like protein n=1 Tax=Antricoccus suffuscus TaxID=1629062 RepID=A0A2T1A3K3_9ACTN|nr:thiamine pyrophosphate-binding protein [Antricoccus suffuscus]PRZ43190.1 thiamine pyrophosphate-dependent acetolactate synthase large subunit-like protein [Antricoccus suffuscus]
MQVHEAIAAALLEHDVDTVFGLMGDANMLYLTSYQKQGGRFVGAAHEGNSVGMADAYARLTGKTGVASVTHGPALTNTLTSLVEAVRSRSNVLLITGDTPPEPTYFQQVDIAAVAAAAGAGYEKVYRPKTLVRDLNRALQRVTSEQRAIVLDIPISMMQADVGDQAVAGRAVAPALGTPDQDALERAVGLALSANRPVVLAGRGAVDSGARDELVALAEKLGAPLATTLLGKDYFAGQPQNLGIYGNLSHSVASGAIGEADCVLVFGASLNAYTSHGGSLFAGKKVVHVDADPGRFGWYTPVTEPIAADARLTAAAMNALIDEAGHKPNTGWVSGLQKALAEYSPRDAFKDRSGVDTVDIRTAMIRLNELLPAKHNLVTDIGRFVLGAWPYLHVADPADFTTMGAFGSIGLGMGGAVGVAVAKPDQPTVAVFGDGGFMMNLADFTTAIREKLNILFVVLNDGAYGAEHYKLRDYGVDPDYSLTTWPELAPMAEAMGARAATIRKIEEFDAVPDLLAAGEGPCLIDVRLDPNLNILDEQ